MENEILAKIEAQNVKIDAIYTSVEKTRKYFLTTMWITIILFALPILGLIIVVPMFISSYMNSFQGLM
jgi:TRAP-type mannitol/chloroaromatic compound transport system permease small subunit